MDRRGVGGIQLVGHHVSTNWPKNRLSIYSFLCDTNTFFQKYYSWKLAANRSAKKDPFAFKVGTAFDVEDSKTGPEAELTASPSDGLFLVVTAAVSVGA